jgi:transcriptional regulator with XRE-family HTH domain
MFGSGDIVPMKRSTPAAAGNRPDLGSALKRLRSERGISLSSLATLSGMPQSTLSKVESGQMSLNYEKLVRLAATLEIDIRQLFTTEAEAALDSGRMARRVIDRWREPEGRSQHYRFRYLSTELRNRLMLPMILDISPTVVPDAEIEMMNVVGQRFVYVLEGPVDFLSDQYEAVTLEAGDAIYIDAAMPHAFVTRDKRRARVLSMIASSIPEYLELARQATAHGNADASNAFRARRGEPVN